MKQNLIVVAAVLTVLLPACAEYISITPGMALCDNYHKRGFAAGGVYKRIGHSANANSSTGTWQPTTTGAQTSSGSITLERRGGGSLYMSAGGAAYPVLPCQ